MKKYLFFVAVATLFAVSCQKENGLISEQNKNNKALTFKASIEQLGGNAQSQNPSQAPVKGTINASNQLVWATGDQIGIFFNSWAENKNQSFTLSSGEGSTEGEFTIDTGWSFNPADATAAFYPWDDNDNAGDGTNNNVSGGTVYFTLHEGNYGYTNGKMITPLVASLSSSSNISFKHAGAAVKVHINNVPAHSKSIGMSVEGQQVYGYYHIDAANAGTGALEVNGGTADNSKNSVWLNYYNGETTAWDFIFPVPELTKPKLNFSMYDDNNIEVWHKNLKAQSSDLGRGDILVMPPIDITPYSQFSESAEWTFCGTINGSTWVDDIPMYTDGAVTILRGIKFKENDHFKIRKDGKWDEAYPGSDRYINAAEAASAKDVWFNNSSHEITLVDAKCEYPSPMVTLYFGINSSGGSGIALSSSGLGASGWPGVTLENREYINGKWYYKYEVAGGTVWGKTISASIVGIGSWNTNSTSLDFSTVKTEYYFEATKSTNITQLGSRPSDPAHQTITIGTNLTDWAGVSGQTSGTSTIKVESDDDYVYIYCERTSASSEIWAGGGYLYIGFDLDNNASTGTRVVWDEHPYEFYSLIYPYGGTSGSPAFFSTSADAVSAGKNAWSSSPSGHAGNITLYGEESSGTATFELRIPRVDIPGIPASGNPIGVELLGNKSFSAVSITHKLK